MFKKGEVQLIQPYCSLCLLQAQKPKIFYCDQKLKFMDLILKDFSFKASKKGFFCLNMLLNAIFSVFRKKGFPFLYVDVYCDQSARITFPDSRKKISALEATFWNRQSLPIWEYSLCISQNQFEKVKSTHCFVLSAVTCIKEWENAILGLWKNVRISFYFSLRKHSNCVSVRWGLKAESTNVRFTFSSLETMNLV